LTFGQSAQHKSCGKYSNLSPYKISHFTEVPKYFSYFYSLLLIYSIGKITMSRFLRGRPSSALSSSQSSMRSRPMPSASSGCCQAGPNASWTPHVSLSPSQAETVTHPTHYGARYPPKPIPFLCPSPHCPLVKFRPCFALRCSIQVSVTCPSHPYACRLACGPLASRIAAEASRRPAVSIDRYHRYGTAVMSVPSTR
jgi:hypothetical protein